MNAAVEAARLFDVEIVDVPKSKAGPDANAPEVYFNDRLIADKSAISFSELADELMAAGVPKR